MPEVELAFQLEDDDGLSRPMRRRDLSDLVDDLDDGRQVVATPGTAVPLVGVATPCKWVLVSALKSNLDQVSIGGPNVVAGVGAEVGQELLPGEAVTLPVNDVVKVFVDARLSGEGVTFTWGV